MNYIRTDLIKRLTGAGNLVQQTTLQKVMLLPPQKLLKNWPVLDLIFSTCKLKVF